MSRPDVQKACPFNQVACHMGCALAVPHTLDSGHECALYVISFELHWIRDELKTMGETVEMVQDALELMEEREAGS